MNVGLRSFVGLGGLVVAAFLSIGTPATGLADGEGDKSPARLPSRVTVTLGPTVNANNPYAETAVATPRGNAVVTTRFIPARDDASRWALTAGGSGTCVSEFRDISFRFTTYTPWKWDYSTITWMGTTSYSYWALPLFWWDSMYTYNDWAPGWQYAWGNGRATMKYGTKPIGFPLFSVHVNALVDAWGNCTPAVSVRWF